jgi:hypothetical protein
MLPGGLDMPYKDLLIDLLLDKGFSVDEAEQLISLRERIEQQQAQEESLRNFARWLVKRGRLDEFKDA